MSGQAAPNGDDAYDRLPYTDHAYAEAHPDRLAVVARLSGWLPPAVPHARVLEIGCGRGGNLLPMASALPDATFVGVDRSARQIDEARTIARAASLPNVTWHAASFEDAAVGGGFDYALCHGVASWVPVATRRALFGALAQALSADGVAHVSFNVLPGWYERLAARDWLRFASGRESFPEDAGGALGWLAARVPPERAEYKHLMTDVARRIAETDAAYAAHEFLAAEHHPELVSHVLAEAEEAGLTYLGDAIPQMTALELLDPDVAARAEGLDVQGAQQLVDFVTGAAFRRALFVRSDAAASRGFRSPRRLDSSALASLHIASRLRADAGAGADVERFVGGGLTVEIAEPAARRALHELARVAPASLPFDEIARRAGGGAELATELFDVWLATGALDLHAFEPRLATFPSVRPRACPVARLRAQQGGPITNVWHHGVVLPDALTRAVLAHADGSRNDEEIAHAIDTARSTELVTAVRASLVVLASLALLVE